MIVWQLDGPEWDKRVTREARRLCQAYCRAMYCVDTKTCRSIWPGPGGALSSYFKEAKERLMVEMADTA
jgi:hypothetical protein